MKIITKILIFLLLISSSITFAIEDEITLSEQDLMENEHEVIYEKPIVLEEVEPYSKEALKGIVSKDYDINSAQGMFHRQLEARFEKGLIKSAGLQGNFIQNVGDYYEGKNDFKYNFSLINIGLKGDFRSEKEGYNLLFDLTPNIDDNFFHRLVLDAWIETRRIPHHTLMFGTSRPNVGYEGGQSPYLIPFLARSQTARNFGNIRKTGIRLKGDYKYIDYDIGGFSSDTWYSEFFPGVETDIWVNFKPFANKKDKLGDLNLGGGIEAGARNSQDFFVATACIRYEYKNFWLRAEYANADGSNGASGLTSRKAWGYNVTLAYRLTKKLEFLLRYDDFDKDKTIANNNTKEYSAGINYYILGQTLRLMLNYVFCQNENTRNSQKLLLGMQVLL